MAQEPKVHFLNVRLGDCILFERASDRLTVIDMCCGNVKEEELLKVQFEAIAYPKPKGNYDRCQTPTNPVRYLEEKSLSSIWRFILTHPDMDHMAGIRELFQTKTVTNFWDCGIRKGKPDFTEGPYKEEDWDFYKNLIDGKVSGTNIIKPRAGDTNKYWNAGDNPNDKHGDWLEIVSPTEEMIANANADGDINAASYVIVYQSNSGPVIFAGDSIDTTWEYILDRHRDKVANAAVLFSPHHGRKAEQDWSFLDVVKPRVSFFGCAPSEHLAYSAYQNRKLLYFTNNQCGNVHVYPARNKHVEVFIENKTYASDYTIGSTYQEDGYWFLCRV